MSHLRKSIINLMNETPSQTAIEIAVKLGYDFGEVTLALYYLMNSGKVRSVWYPDLAQDKYEVISKQSSFTS